VLFNFISQDYGLQTIGFYDDLNGWRTSGLKRKKQRKKEKVY
jgi:hypothetical protein